MGAASMSPPACLILQVSLPCPKLETHAFHIKRTKSDFKDWGWKIQYIATKAISVVLVFMVVMSCRVTAIVQSLALFNREAHVVSFGIIVMVPIVDMALERTLFSFLNIFFGEQAFDWTQFD